MSSAALPDPLVAFQGEPGAFSQQAARQHYGAAVRTLPCPSFRSVFEAVEQGRAQRGLLPIENTLGSSILEVFDLLWEHDLSVVGETQLQIVHNLIANPGVSIEGITRVYAHPQAAAQCERFLRERPEWSVRQVYDTAGSVKMIRDEQILDGAGIASASAAELFEMEILAPSIQSVAENFTRFVEVAPERLSDPGADKASVVFGTRNQPGALLTVLQAFADHGVNLVKLESRPIPGRPWEYLFFADLGGEPGPALLDALCRTTTRLKLLGTYRASLGEGAPAPGI